jgi:predicted GNAT family N-acyltransferase
MLRIELMPWEKARAHAAPIRFTVFVEEQGVPFEIELDKLDLLSIHVVAFEDEKPVATGRLLPDGHIGRMAVLKVQALVQRAKERGYHEVALSAQVHAVPFYRAHGFLPEGDEYLEAGIRHQAMKRKL